MPAPVRTATRLTWLVQLARSAVQSTPAPGASAAVTRPDPLGVTSAFDPDCTGRVQVRVDSRSQFGLKAVLVTNRRRSGRRDRRQRRPDGRRRRHFPQDVQLSPCIVRFARTFAGKRRPAAAQMSRIRRRCRARTPARRANAGRILRPTSWLCKSNGSPKHEAGTMTDGTDGPASRGAEGQREGEPKPDDGAAGGAHGGGAEGDGEPAGVAEDHGAYAVATPEQLLSQARSVRRDARRARHANWFPLVLFGLLTCASVPFYIRNVPFVDEFYRSRHAGFAFLQSEYFGGFAFSTGAGIAYYWLAAILVGLAATAVWYRLRGNRVGLRTPSRGFIITGLMLVVLALLIPVLASLPGLGQLVILMPGDLLIRGTFPLVLIGIGLCALAWAERSIALAVIAAGYLAVSFVASLYD